MTTPATPSFSGQIPAMMATLACYEGMFGPYHPLTLGVATSLAIELCESGRREEGRPLLQRALLDLTRHHAADHPVRLRALQAWSALLNQDGDSHAALLIQRELADSRAQPTL
jgi:hypothetical protein